ncbi:pantetheine-phosphate adenylyltransferase [Marinilactibacillus sp. Marseille-P9653]|uniref:pantetheine-phosphate adenylyltransferase n=1 Tax=Marinilactibacillus sp. Marseille-P9653 TaxID=2866583 RepID=UPI001CE4147B|nr:pantetheine-phosphate adenylyltransferase [Marinilactibacillus sp. Marseille-P9653]
MKALYAGSFDPFTNGHLDIVQRASTLFDEVIIAVSENISKQPLFDVDQRMQMIIDSLESQLPDSNVKVLKHKGGLTIDLAEELEVKALIRGIRSIKDMEYEMDIASMNKTQNKEIETVFLMSDEHYRFVSSSLVKEVAKFHGNIQGLVPENIEKQIKQKNR